jgi:hypothetical protein
MPRKKSGFLKPKPPRLLHVATRLPSDPPKLHMHCVASWEGIRSDPTHFPSPYPPPAEVEEALEALGKALVAASKGNPVDKLAVQTAAIQLRDIWGHLGRYVQRILRALPPDEAGPILARVLMYASNVGTKRPKQPLTASHESRSGVVRLVALAVPDAITYIWEWSWNEVDWSTTTTGESYVTLEGLTPGKLYTFRFRCFLRGNTLTNEIAAITFMVT